MKKTILIISFLMVCISLSAQPYQKLLGNSNYWYHTSCTGPSCITESYWAYEDTIVENNTYKILDSYHYNRTMLIREDTALKRIYAMPTVGYSANRELVLYDFSLTIGQSMELFNPNSPAPNEPGFYVLDSINTIQIVNGTHRAFYLSEVGGSKKTIWVEGVGSLTLISTPSEHPNISTIGDLSCFYRDGNEIYRSDSLPNGPCDTTGMFVGVEAYEMIEREAYVYPNPCKGIFNVSVGNHLKGEPYSIINIDGQTVKQGMLNGTNQIDLTDFPSGVYVFMINNGKVSVHKRIIKME